MPVFAGLAGELAWAARVCQRWWFLPSWQGLCEDQDRYLLRISASRPSLFSLADTSAVPQGSGCPCSPLQVLLLFGFSFAAGEGEGGAFTCILSCLLF